MAEQNDRLPAAYAINIRAVLTAALITCGLVAITWLCATHHINVQ